MPILKKIGGGNIIKTHSDMEEDSDDTRENGTLIATGRNKDATGNGNTKVGFNCFYFYFFILQRKINM